MPLVSAEVLALPKSSEMDNLFGTLELGLLCMGLLSIWTASKFSMAVLRNELETKGVVAIKSSLRLVAKLLYACTRVVTMTEKKECE